jgi:hypothetical protein
MHVTHPDVAETLTRGPPPHSHQPSGTSRCNTGHSGQRQRSGCRRVGLHQTLGQRVVASPISSSDCSKVDRCVVGCDGVEFPVPEVEITSVADEGSDSTSFVVVVNSKSSISRDSCADRAASVLFFESSGIFTLCQSVCFDDVSFVVPVGLGLLLGPRLT